MEDYKTNVLPLVRHHCEKLHAIVKQSGEALEGNCMTYHQQTEYANELLTKQLNLYSLYKSLPLESRVLEIGVNAGHSLLLFLMASKCSIDLHDIGEHSYLLPCLKYLDESFPNRKIHLSLGDSRMTLFQRTLQGERDVYDCIHLDGGHSMDCFVSDITNSLLLLKKGGILIIDDTNDYEIFKYTQFLLEKGFIQRIEQHDTYLYKHMIVRKN